MSRTGMANLVMCMLVVLMVSLFAACASRVDYIDSIESVSQTAALSFRDSMFTGGGEWYALGGGELMWWYYAFGVGFYAINGYIIRDIGSEAFSAWTNEFSGVTPSGWRDPREAHMVTLIEDFAISVEDYIRALEVEFGMSIVEVDALVAWARTVHVPTAPDAEALEASFWMHQRSISDIEALFSNNVYKLWDAFPGVGIVLNGRAYTPEWIVHNITNAIHDEQIPLDEIDRIIGQASYHTILDVIRRNAETVFQAEVAIMRESVDRE